jgi:excisionase family DNA binding protein
MSNSNRRPYAADQVHNEHLTIMPKSASTNALRLLHLSARMRSMTATTEIRPGSVKDRDLDSLEHVLSDRGQPAISAARLVGPEGELVDIPKEIVELLTRVVGELKLGNGVSVIAVNAELTTVEAAEILNVSRPHLVKQLEAGALAFRLVGSHRRIRLVDVLAYRDRVDARAHAALDAMTRDAEEFGLYD